MTIFDVFSDYHVQVFHKALDMVAIRKIARNNMRKIYNYILIVCFVLLATTCNAQFFSTKNLIGTKWECTDGDIEYYEFTNDSIIESIYFPYNGWAGCSKPFYLSDVKNESFDSTKIGTETSGRYLLTYNKKTKCTEYCEITKLTPDTLELFYEAKENHIGAANMYFTYRRVKTCNAQQQKRDGENKRDSIRSLRHLNASQGDAFHSDYKVLKASDILVEKRIYGPDEVRDVTDKMPSFPGGMGALMQYLKGNIDYPIEAFKKNIGGRVVVAFIVEKDGSLSDVRIAKSVHPLLDAEAIRVVSSMPKWNPGLENGNPVRVKYTIPVTFRLEEKKN